MKIITTLSLIVLLSTTAYSQIGISYHQSYLSFAGVSYQLGERFNPEFRVGANTLLYNISPELVVNYQFIKKTEYQVYAGLGEDYKLMKALSFQSVLTFTPLKTSDLASIRNWLLS